MAVFLRVCVRMVQLIALSALAAPSLLAAALAGRRSRHRLAAGVARLLERFGGAFIKAGQLLATRADLVGVPLAEALGRLHDEVRPMTEAQARATVAASFAASFSGAPAFIVAAVSAPPVASGSIACVYQARMGERDLAVKVRRPGIAAAFAADIAIVTSMARALSRLPWLRRVPMAEIAEQLGASLMGQLDFAKELRHLGRLRDDLADVAGVVVPSAVEELSAGGVITMEFVDGLDRRTAGELTDGARQACVVRLVGAVYRLLFVTGFIHVDLHQGNVYFRRDGSVVVLDAGFMFQLGETARERFTQFFSGMIRGDGEFCANILLSTVRRMEPDADLESFRKEAAALVERSAGAVAGDFELAAFAVELFDLQRRNRLFAAPEFVFPLLSLLSLEGAVRRWYPSMDFQIEAAPYVMHGLLLADPAVT
ncbi:ABC1 kinase family protein [Nonomuraea wenchangensis]